MRILVTGKEGQLARALAAAAASRPDLQVVFAGRPELDLERPGGLGPAVRAAAPDLVINAAAWTAVDQAEDEPERAFRINADAAGELARAARQAGLPMIQISTDYVFDGGGEDPYAPIDAPNPQTVYGRSKLAGEVAVRNENPDHLIVRTAWVYSAYGRNFVRTMLGLAATRDEIRVVADQFGSPTSAIELANGLLQAADIWLTTRAVGPGTYHLAGSGRASWFDLAGRVFEQSEALGGPSARLRPIATEEWETRAVRPRQSQLDSSAFARDFGYACADWPLSVASVVRELLAPEPSRENGLSPSSDRVPSDRRDDPKPAATAT